MSKPLQCHQLSHTNPPTTAPSDVSSLHLFALLAGEADLIFLWMYDLST
jgi:hypothetical protein